MSKSILSQEQQENCQQISRRTFLKVSGTAMLGMLLSMLPEVEGKTGFPPPPDIEDLLAIASKSRTFEKPFELIRDCEFDSNVSSKLVQFVSRQDQYVGLVLKHGYSVTQRQGGNLILTIDAKMRELVAAQVLIGWSLLDTLLVQSMIFDIKQPPFQEINSGRDYYLNESFEPEWIWPRTEHIWLFPRPNSPSFRPEDAIETGWPPEGPDTHYWQFKGCSAVAWETQDDVSLYRCTQVAEFLPGSDIKEFVVSLTY